MIVKNEAATLPKCLSSVNKVVDEMVVLDTGSIDRTPYVAQEFGAKVHHFKWCDDFSAARNAALKYVTGDWVLVLEDLQKANRSETVLIVPVAIQYSYDKPPWTKLNWLLSKLEA
ncbi:hypothetical protein VF13_37255, partial [Nostoc linckia z16]